MKNNSGTRAEDILAEENFLTNDFSQRAEDNQEIYSDERKTAGLIYSFLISSQSTLPSPEKEQLKRQIAASTRTHRLKKQVIAISVAASLLIILSITAILYRSVETNPDIVVFAQNVVQQQPDKDTKIILQNGEEVKITEPESQIKYSSNGKAVLIKSENKMIGEVQSEKSIYNTVVVPYGKRSFIELAEGTKVWLNSGSRLIFPVTFQEKKREVFIEGEAIFEVAHLDDKPFLVNTRDFQIKVLGTVFNVSSYADDKYSSAVLERGKIELNYKGQRLFGKHKLCMSPGTMAIFNPDQKKFDQKQVTTQDFMSWRDGFLYFNRDNLSEILKKLARYYNEKIILTDTEAGNETFSGMLDLKDSVDDVLSVIAETTPIAVKYENNNIVINLK